MYFLNVFVNYLYTANCWSIHAVTGWLHSQIIEWNIYVDILKRILHNLIDYLIIKKCLFLKSQYTHKTESLKEQWMTFDSDGYKGICHSDVNTLLSNTLLSDWKREKCITIYVIYQGNIYLNLFSNSEANVMIKKNIRCWLLELHLRLFF